MSELTQQTITNASKPTIKDTQHALVVDLDFSLLATDLTYESILLCIKQNPFSALLMPFWYLKGKVFFKQKLMDRVMPDVEHVPINESVLSFVREERAKGRRTILATASHIKVATAVAERVQAFDDVIATSNGPNLGGIQKVEAIRALIGTQAFDYVGDRSADIPIWKASARCIAVNPSASLAKKLGREFDLSFSERPTGFGRWLRAIRVHQWLKNLLLFLPLLLAHKVGDIDLIFRCVLAFAAFSLCASAVYVFNDLMDLEADRAHPTKRRRPFAAGTIPLHKGAALIPLLLIGSAICALNLSWQFSLALVAYAALTTAYSFYLKRIAIVDVLVLAGLYVYRVLCGAIAVQVYISTWMLAFSMFMFLSLAFVKRYSELIVLRDEMRDKVRGRGYRVDDADLLRSVGTASGYMAVLVMALYINSSDVVRLYQHPVRLWLIEPLLLYWITRVWYIAHRGEMRDDPVVFALEDRTSYLVVGCMAIVVVLATLPIDLF